MFYLNNADTVPPTAYITAATSYTNSFNVPVNISFSKPCTGGGGFRCSSTDTCNLLVYGAGQVVPTTLNIIEPGLEYSLTVSLYSSIQYGRVILVMDRNFCTDLAGNKFTRTEKSHLFVRFDRRSVFVNIRTHVPEQLIQLNGETRTVQATNNHENLKVEDLSTVSIVTISLNSSLIISRQGTAVSPVAPVTFLFDSQRPSVRLTTISSTRKRASHNSVLIKFTKPVFGFNSSYLSISGGHLYSFQEVSRSIYVVQTKAYNYTVSISIPENVTEDVAGNKNMPSNILQVRHNFVPVVSVLSTIASVSFVVTAIVAGLLTLSTASLQSIGAFSVPSSSLTSDPARNLFRIACHIQVFALSRWLAVTLPIEYCEFVRGLQWSIPYFSLPWEKRQIHPFPVSSNSTTPHSYYSEIHRPESFKNVESQAANSYVAASIYGLPLTAMEYRSFFESHNIKPEAESLMEPHNSNGWRDFERNMFWLAVIGGSLILLHVLLLLILKLRKKNTENENSYGALLFQDLKYFFLFLQYPLFVKAQQL
ncbi:unnamed protein product [Thlaspi arvense]|uniref:Bacterial Ig-like domain-containing protein n=1 Tax=Thlaspi arvense TaxID=13288 RepID=A0AAU9RTR8_THLAR|nr:unnamed protein product [Thlaspi arvense]